MVLKLTSSYSGPCVLWYKLWSYDMPAGTARVAAIMHHELVFVTLATHCHALYPILPLVIHAHGLFTMTELWLSLTALCRRF